MRSSHKRKHSVSTSLNLSGRRSPVPGLYQDQKSPQGSKSPILFINDQLRSPLGLPPQQGRRSPTNLLQQDNRSPTNLQPQGRRSPIGFYQQGYDYDRRSPTNTIQVQERKSPLTLLPDLDFDRRSPTSQILVQGRRSPIGFSQGLITSIQITPTDRKSPVGSFPIPPITVSNPSETIALTLKTMKSKPDTPPPGQPGSDGESVQERKEKPSVMKEILAFVRKPSKKVTTRTGKFAAAFSRRESGSGSPLIRQSTFSSAPAASSRAGKNAVTKQMSEVGFEPKMSLKFKSLNTKMSLRLRSRASAAEEKRKDKRSSGDEISDMESSDSKPEKLCSSITSVPFELENVRFEKVGESYIKHEQIREETIEKDTSPIQVVALSQASIDPEDCIKIEPLVIVNDDDQETIETLKKTLESTIGSEPQAKQSIETNVDDSECQDSGTVKSTVQCPTFEIEPPSRRASFDPPRSPYLENLRSPNSTDRELNRFDSGGDSFEIVDTDRNRESSFEDRYSSMDTSFDISRYQSTSYEDQNSSFELVELENNHRAGADKSVFDLRKSSIELVDVETFQQRSGPPEGRKSSLETHFDYSKPPTKPGIIVPKAKKQISEPCRHRDQHASNMKTHHSAPQRARSPLSTQTSSNFSSRDSYDSSFEPISLTKSYHSHRNNTNSDMELKSPFADLSKQHFPLPTKSPNESRTFLCTDHRCAAIFEPRPPRTTSPFLGYQGASSGSEFEPPSPRRAASASPKHTFTFRIVLKKVDSSPDAICPSAERRNADRRRRRDSRRKRLMDTGKSF